MFVFQLHGTNASLAQSLFCSLENEAFSSLHIYFDAVGHSITQDIIERGDLYFDTSVKMRLQQTALRPAAFRHPHCSAVVKKGCGNNLEVVTVQCGVLL